MLQPDNPNPHRIRCPPPRAALARYLIGPAGLLPAAINFGLHYWAGRVLFGSRSAVDLAGARGIAIDTLVGFALIGIATGLLITPAVRRQVREGRLPGRRASPPSWLARTAPSNTGLRSLAIGMAAALLAAGCAVGTLEILGVAPLSGASYAWLKAGLAAAFALGITPLFAWLALSDETDRYQSPGRLRRDEIPRVQSRFEYLDKGCLAATSEVHGCSNAPTWQLVARGHFDPNHVRTAIADLLTRYPSCRWVARSTDAAPEAALAFFYVESPRWTPDEYLSFIDLRGESPGSIDAVTRRVHDRFVDLFSEPPIHFTFAQIGDDSWRIYAKQHHALADGRAFIELLHDFAAFIDAAARDTRPQAAQLHPIPRRAEREALGVSPARHTLWGLQGLVWTLGVIGRAVARPLTPLFANLSNDYRGSDGVVHWIVPDGALESWNAARRTSSVSLNSFLAAAYVAATAEWSRELGVSPGRSNAAFIAETRPRDGSFVSFANHFTSLYVEMDLANRPDPSNLAQAIQSQVRRLLARSLHYKKLATETLAARYMPIQSMRKMVFASDRAPLHFNFSNLISLPFPNIQTPGFTIERVLICTPCTPRCGILLTVIRYGGELVFNFNYKASVVSREQIEALVRRFADTLAIMSARESLGSSRGTLESAGDDGAPLHRPLAPGHTPPAP